MQKKSSINSGNSSTYYALFNSYNVFLDRIISISYKYFL